MRVHQGRWRQAALLLALAVVGGSQVVRATQVVVAVPAVPLRWNTMSVDMKMLRGVMVDAKGRLATTAVETRYHIERKKAGSRWAWTMTIDSPVRPPFFAPGGVAEPLPSPISRLEDPGDGKGIRVYSPQGLMRTVAADRDRFMKVAAQSLGGSVALPGVAASGVAGEAIDPASVTDTAWVDALLPSAAGKVARRAALKKRFGKGGTLGRFDRFVVTSGTDTTEILADPDWGLPVEVNVVKAGVLDRHTTYSYTPAGADTLVRTRVRSEQRLGAADATGVVPREVVDVEFSGLRFEDRR